MISSNKKTHTFGMNKHIYIQTSLNSKRKKRRGKNIKPSKKDTLIKVIPIFLTGELVYTTHYREVDPYWGIMWRQYEYLRYIEIYLKKAINDSVINKKLDVNSETYNNYIDLLKQTKKWQKKLITWLFNAFHMQIGGVLSSRFYGWKDKYGSKFATKFYEVALDIISKLRFDIDKTRCSVYFYQAFWLSGLTVINELRNKMNNEENVTTDSDRGTKIYSSTDTNIEDFDNYVLNEQSNKDENAEPKIDLGNKQEITLSELKNIENLSTDSKHLIEHKLRYEILDVLKSILKRAGIPENAIHTNKKGKENRAIQLASKRIKKLIRSGKLKLTDKERYIISRYLGRPLIKA